MAVFSLSWTDPLADVCRYGAVTFGNFDGVHLGHQALLRSVRDQARAVGGPAVAVTFATLVVVSVVCALPLGSVVTTAVLNEPLSAVNETGTPGSTFPFVSRTKT